MIFKQNPWTLFQINKEIKSLFQEYIFQTLRVGYTRRVGREIIEFTQEQKQKYNGHELDKLLSDYFKNLNYSFNPPSQSRFSCLLMHDVPHPAKDLVTTRSEIYPGLKFLDSKLPLYGFMQDRDTDDKRMVAQSYLWQGEADAIARCITASTLLHEILATL